MLVAINVYSLTSIGFAEAIVIISYLPWQVFVIEREGIHSGVTVYPIDNLRPHIAEWYVGFQLSKPGQLIVEQSSHTHGRGDTVAS